MDRKPKRCTQISGVMLFLCCIVFSAFSEKSSTESVQYDREIKQKSGVLDSIREELKRGRQKLVELESQEGNVQEKIVQVEKNIVSSRTYINLLSGKIDSVEKQITVLKDSATAAGKRLLDRQKIMEMRLRQAYMTGNPNLIMQLMSSSSPTDFINKTRYVQELKHYDEDLIHQIGRARSAFDDRKSSYQDEKARLDALVSTKTLEHSNLLKEEEKRKGMLDNVRGQKKSWESTLAELERSQRELNEIIRILESKRKKAKQQVDIKKVQSFERSKGKMDWPIKGSVVSKFGKVVHPVYKTVTMNSGIDISPSGSGSVLSVGAGTVIHTGSMRGLGKLVIVDHGAGYITVYAHLSEISVKSDQAVTNGSVLGRINVSSAEKSLHFEIRKSTDSLDPLDWLE